MVVEVNKLYLRPSTSLRSRRKHRAQSEANIDGRNPGFSIQLVAQPAKESVGEIHNLSFSVHPQCPLCLVVSVSLGKFTTGDTENTEIAQRLLVIPTDSEAGDRCVVANRVLSPVPRARIGCDDAYWQ